MALSDNAGEENTTIYLDDITIELCDYTTSNIECQTQDFKIILNEVLKIEEHSKEECEGKYRDDQQEIKD